jgi:hypothetical protein
LLQRGNKIGFLQIRRLGQVFHRGAALRQNVDVSRLDARQQKLIDNLLGDIDIRCQKINPSHACLSLIEVGHAIAGIYQLSTAAAKHPVRRAYPETCPASGSGMPHSLVSLLFAAMALTRTDAADARAAQTVELRVEGGLGGV